MAKRAKVSGREEANGGTRRRMGMVLRWVCLEWPWGSVWMRRARFSGARALGGSSPMRLGGLAGFQLTGPVAETPDVDSRRRTASHHHTERRV